MLENKDIEQIMNLVEKLNSEINESIGKFKAVADLDFEPSVLPGGRFVLANKNFPNNLYVQRDIVDEIYKIINNKYYLKNAK